MDRKAYIEFASQDSITITTPLRQKSFDLGKLYAKYGQAYIDLVNLDIIGVDELGLDKVDRELRFIADFNATSLSILAKPRSDGEWMRIGHARMGIFQYWYAGQRADLPPDEAKRASEGTFRIKII